MPEALTGKYQSSELHLVVPTSAKYKVPELTSLNYQFELKPPLEKCENVFIKGKDIVSLLPTRIGERPMYQLVSG